MSYSWLREGVESAPITRGDLDQIENYADRLFAKVGIDVEFTRHFLDRVNDERNKRQITMAELTRLFKQEYKKYGKKIAQLGPDAEAVMKDMKTDVNMPFILRWDSKNQELDLVAKTVMRKKDFHTPDPEFAVESVSSSDLVDEFLKSTGGKYGKRDMCGPACLDFRDWARREKGIELKRVRGEFVADEVVSAKADFTPEMKKEFAQSGLDWNSAADRKAWIEQSKYAEEWKRVPHYWTVDSEGNIHDPSGYQQLVKTGLAKDLDPSRYIPEGVNEIKMEVIPKDTNTKNDFDEFIGNTKKVATFKGYDLHFAENNLSHHYLIKDPNDEGFLGNLTLKKYSNYWQSEVWFDPEIQGKGFGLPLYVYVIKKGYTLVSDSIQSIGSREGIWKKLTQVPGINVYAWNQKYDEFFSWDPEEEEDGAVYYDPDEISRLEKKYKDGEMSYDDFEKAKSSLGRDHAYQGVRLVATLKEGVNKDLSESTKMSGKELFNYFQTSHSHEPDNNQDMKKFMLSHNWELRDFTPDMFPSEEDFADYDDPFNRVIDIDTEHHVDLSQTIIVGPQYSDGKYSVIDGNHRAAAAQRMGKTIKGYFPVQLNETSPFALAKRFIDPVIKHGSYEKAAKTLYDILRRKKKEDGKLRHGISYYAQQLAKSFAGVDYRALEDYLRDHYDIAQFESKYTSMELAIMEGGHALEDAYDINHNPIKFVEPQFNVEWEEAERYPEFQKIGKEAWIELAKTGKAVEITDASDIENTDAADPDAFKNLDINKQLRATTQLKKGTVEMPIIAVYSDGYKELIGGNTRLTAMMANYGRATVWQFEVPDEIALLAEGPISKALGTAAIAGALALGSNWSDKLPSTGDVANTDQAQVTQTVKQDPKVLPKSKPAVYKPITSSKNETILAKTAQANGIKGVELAAFMAQMAHESENFKDMVEDNPNIKKYATGKTAKALGNKSKNDAERFIGRGFIQLTGRWNYEWMQKKLGIDLTSTWSKAHQASKPEVAAQIAVEFWKSRVRPNVKDWTDVAQVTRPINKALHGLDHREARFEKIMLAMNEWTVRDVLQAKWLREDQDYMYGACHVWALQDIKKHPERDMYARIGVHYEDDREEVDHIFTVDPKTGNAYDVRGEFEDADDLLADYDFSADEVSVEKISADDIKHWCSVGELKPINELKIEKPDAKDTMGIKRNQMPQIATEDYPEFIDYLKDNGASFTKDTVHPKSLKAIQGEFSDSGVLKALKKRKLEKPIIASSDNYIIDGHHRWIAALNTGVDVNIYRVNKPGKELLQLVKDFPKTTYKDIYEAVGIITAQNTTKDVKPGETQRQAAKFGMKVDKNNNPPLLHKKAAKNSTPNKLFNIGLT